MNDMTTSQFRLRGLLLSLTLGASLLSATASAGNLLDRVIAVVNDEIILDTEVLQATEMEARQALANVDRDSAEGQRRYDELRDVYKRQLQ